MILHSLILLLFAGLVVQTASSVDNSNQPSVPKHVNRDKFAMQIERRTAAEKRKAEKKRQRQSEKRDFEGELLVRVKPKQFVLKSSEEGQSTSFRCVTRSIETTEYHFITISFFLQLDNQTVLPLSSGIPGVDIVFTESVVTPVRTAEHRALPGQPAGTNVTTSSPPSVLYSYKRVTNITFNSQFFKFLSVGNSRFFCTAKNHRRIFKSDTFSIKKLRTRPH